MNMHSQMDMKLWKNQDWYIVTVNRIASYQKHSRIADSLREEVENFQPKITHVHSLAPVKAGLSDHTIVDAGKHIDSEIIYRYHNNESILIDLAISMLLPEKQFIVRRRFVEGKKDSDVMKLLDNNFGHICQSTYCKRRDEAIRRLSMVFGYQRIGV